MKKYVLWGKELGVPVAEIEVEDESKITLMDDRFELSEIKEVEVSDVIEF